MRDGPDEERNKTRDGVVRRASGPPDRSSGGRSRDEGRAAYVRKGGSWIWPRLMRPARAADRLVATRDIGRSDRRVWRTMALHEPILSAALLHASAHRIETYPTVVIRTPLASSADFRPVSVSCPATGRAVFRLLRIQTSPSNVVYRCGGSGNCKRCGPSCSLRTINSRSHLLMSAEPIPLSLWSRAGCPCAVMKIHKAKGGAIFLNGDVSRSARTVAPLSRMKPVHSFQGVDESLGITVARCNRVCLARVGFFYRRDAGSACGIGISGSCPPLSP